MMRILANSGVPFEADETNSYETRSTNNLKSYNEWILELKPGTAIKVLFPQCLYLPVAGDYKCLWMTRNSREQAKSQAKMADLNRFSTKIRAKSIKKVNGAIPPELKRLGAEVLKVSFEKLIRKDFQTMELIEDFTNWGLDFSCIADRKPKFSGLEVGALEMAR